MLNFKHWFRAWRKVRLAITEERFGNQSTTTTFAEIGVSLSLADLIYAGVIAKPVRSHPSFNWSHHE